MPARCRSRFVIWVGRANAVGAAGSIGAESRTASLYTALWDEYEYSSGPRYKPRTVSSGLLARFSPCSV
jgi:hypothetical protein